LPDDIHTSRFDAAVEDLFGPTVVASREYATGDKYGGAAWTFGLAAVAYAGVEQVLAYTTAFEDWLLWGDHSYTWRLGELTSYKIQYGTGSGIPTKEPLYTGVRHAGGNVVHLGYSLTHGGWHLGMGVGRGSGAAHHLYVNYLDPFNLAFRYYYSGP
jgi:hypothetical protein